MAKDYTSYLPEEDEELMDAVPQSPELRELPADDPVRVVIRSLGKGTIQPDRPDSSRDPNYDPPKKKEEGGSRSFVRYGETDEGRRHAAERRSRELEPNVLQRFLLHFGGGNEALAQAYDRARQPLEDYRADRDATASQTAAAQRRSQYDRQLDVQEQAAIERATDRDLDRALKQQQLDLNAPYLQARGQQAQAGSAAIDPASDASAQSRAVILRSIQANPVVAERFGLTPESVAGYSAERTLNAPEVKAYYDFLRKLRRGGGRGGGGVVGDPDADRQTMEIILSGALFGTNNPRALVDAHIDARNAGGMAGRTAERALAATRATISQSDTRAAEMQEDRASLQEATTAADRAHALVSATPDNDLRIVLAARGLPPGFTDERAQQVRAAIDDVYDILARNRSGAAVTEPEFARFMRMAGDLRTANPAVIRGFLSRRLQHMQALDRAVRSRYSDMVVDEGQRRADREADRDAGRLPSQNTDLVPVTDRQGNRLWYNRATGERTQRE